MRKVIGVSLIVLAVVIGLLYFLPYSSERKEVQEQSVEASEVISELQAHEPEEKECPVDDIHSRVDNGDLVAYIEIKDLGIAYPVYTNSEPDYYLHRDSNGNKSTHGCIYTNDINGKPLMLYGHNMNDGSMFAGLMEVYRGAKVDIALADMTWDDTPVTNYEVVDYVSLSANDAENYLVKHKCDLVLVTCSYSTQDSRLLVLCDKVE